ncbi:MAG: hypothetical protein JXR66_01210 [Bacteroidales bacterium]|nr:hypothetical protein [Bacteroidales bacterium]
MKNKILTGLALMLISFGLFTSCETDMEKAQKDYDASQVVPKVLSVTGTTLALQTFTYTYTIGYSRAGSTWQWSATGATLNSVSEDTRTASLTFPTIPTGGKAQLSITETTVGGAISDPKVIEIQVNPFCPLEPSGFVGEWLGTDGMDLDGYYFDSEVVISDATATTVKVSGLNAGWISNVWGETVTDGGTITMIIGDDGTATIENQYIFTTDYEGDPYVYNISGTAYWDNCGASPTLTISYVLETDGYFLPVDWAGDDFPCFYAVITLDTDPPLKAKSMTTKTGVYSFPKKEDFRK